MKNKVLILSSLLLVLFFVNTQAATLAKEIIIDNENRQLVAPEGESYSWYFDGELLTQSGRNLKIVESGNYKVEVINEDGIVSTRTVTVSVSVTGIRKIHIIGDSTVQTYASDKYPFMGWGQVLGLFFNDSKVEIVNHAIGGRSSRSFWEEGRWDGVDGVLNQLDTGDFVFIQFGHNDRDTKPERYTSPEDFKTYMRIYVNESREKGAIPVLISPMVMNAWNGSIARNVFTENGADYRGAMLSVANELNALFVDLNMKSYDLLKKVGWEYAAYFMHMGLLPGEYNNYPDGYSDFGTHYQEMGALQMAKFITDGIEELADEDTDMEYLVDARTEMVPVSTTFSDSLATGLITRSASYPVGATVTIKTRISDTAITFNHWDDSLGNKVSDDNLYMFTIEQGKSYNFVADVTVKVYDCNGDLWGTASVDDCKRCSGGNTGITPCEVVFQSEDACVLPEGYKKTTGTYSGITRTIINTFYVADSSDYFVTYNINASEAGTYDFIFVHKSVVAGEQLSITVNEEVQQANLDLIQNDLYNELAVSLDLEQGDNLITLKSLAVKGGIKFDFLAGFSTKLSEGDCAIVSAKDITIPSATIYPNPFTGNTTIIVEGEFEYRVYASTGQIVSEGRANDNCLIGDNFKTGIYLVQIIQNNAVTTRKILKN